MKPVNWDVTEEDLTTENWSDGRPYTVAATPAPSHRARNYRKPKTFYLAAPSSGIPRAQALAKRVQDATGCTLTHDWMQHILDGNPPSAKAALDDLQAVYEADFVVLIDGPSRGASVELGFAMGTGTPVFALSEKPDMWLEASSENSKPSDWGVKSICATEDELLAQLRLWVSLRS